MSTARLPMLVTIVWLQIVSASFAARPNLILIMADDLGYETIGANGGTSYSTPQLDQLAAQGARFTNCFVQPLCTPTRCQLMTGRYNVRNYIDFGILDPRELTCANYLQQAGYQTCIVGKWQLGQDRELPKRFGFDESCLWQHTRRPPRYANPGLEINGIERDYSSGEYGPDVVCDYALDFITRHQSEPFFVYYPMILTHSPYPPTPTSDNWDPAARADKQGSDVRQFGAMVEYMDGIVGRFVSHLEKLNLRKNTMIVFLGDNGTGRGVRSRMGTRVIEGGKGATTTFGMHVPLIVNWPERVSSRVCHDLVDSTDILPTLLGAAGAPTPDDIVFDGISFLPQLLGIASQPRPWIYSWYFPRTRQQGKLKEFAFNKKYKLYRSGEFFDIEADPHERTPLDVSGAPTLAHEKQSLMLVLSAHI